MNRGAFTIPSPFSSSGDQLHLTGLVTLVCGAVLVGVVIAVIVQMLREWR